MSYVEMTPWVIVFGNRKWPLKDTCFYDWHLVVTRVEWVFGVDGMWEGRISNGS